MAAEPDGRLDVEPALADVVDGVQAALELVDWGPDREGAEAWAVQAVRERLEAVNGRMAVGILRSLDEHPRRQPEGLGLVGAWRIGQHLSWSWPFGRDEGASLCRASLALLEEADRLAAGADWSRARAEKTLGEIDGPGVWRPHGEKWRGVPMAVRMLCGAAAVRWKADRERARVEGEKRRRMVPAPSVHPFAVAVVARGRDGLADAAGSLTKRGVARGVQPIAALVTEGPELLAALKGGATEEIQKALTLMAWISRDIYPRWANGDQDYHRVMMPASEAVLRKLGFRSDSKREPGERPGERPDGSVSEVLERLLSLLAGVSVDGLGPLVRDVRKVELQSGPKGGGQATALTFTAGDAMCPQALVGWLERKNIKTMPEGLRFYGPAFHPGDAPLVGNKRTRAAQRAAFSVGAGQWLMSVREEYAERGGIRLDDAKRPGGSLRRVLDGFGIYHRSHASLVDVVVDAWRGSTQSDSELALTDPLLVETARGSGVYRLGEHPDFRAAERMILDAAGVSERARKGDR